MSQEPYLHQTDQRAACDDNADVEDHSGHHGNGIDPVTDDATLPSTDEHTRGHMREDMQPPTAQSPVVMMMSGSSVDAQEDRPRTQETLAENLRTVSLSAVAEPYLGSISGLTFAKLTQAVLRRLSPDGRDFVFSPQMDGNAVPIEGATNLHLDFVNSMYFDYDQSIDFSLLTGEGALPTFEAGMQDTINDFPDRTEVLRLATFYFDHSHTLYPIVHQQEVMSDFHSILMDPEHHTTQSPPCMFRIWMVLAIGSTTYSSITLAEESLSRMYYEKAMTYFEASMDHGDIVSTPVGTGQSAVRLTHRRLRWKLSCSKYLFHSSTSWDQVCHSTQEYLIQTLRADCYVPDTWFLVGTAARLAIGMGLHCDATLQGLPIDQIERRKRLFFSVYMMDR
jgi:hypothetical protein